MPGYAFGSRSSNHGTEALDGSGATACQYRTMRSQCTPKPWISSKVWLRSPASSESSSRGASNIVNWEVRALAPAGRSSNAQRVSRTGIVKRGIHPGTARERLFLRNVTTVTQQLTHESVRSRHLHPIGVV